MCVWYTTVYGTYKCYRNTCMIKAIKPIKIKGTGPYTEITWPLQLYGF